MSIPTYFQEFNNFGRPNGHPNEADFIAEGLTEIDPATGHPHMERRGTSGHLRND